MLLRCRLFGGWKSCNPKHVLGLRIINKIGRMIIDVDTCRNIQKSDNIPQTFDVLEKNFFRKENGGFVMATATAVEVDRDEAVALFVELGFKTAGAWDTIRLQKKLSSINQIAEDASPKTQASKDLLENVLEAITEETEIKITGGKKGKKSKPSDDDENDSPVTPVGKKNKKVQAKVASSKNGKAKVVTGKKKGQEKKAPVNAFKGAASNGRPGVINSIISILQGATERKPVTKKEIHASLVKLFPDRTADAMQTTVNLQVPSKLRKDKGLTVQKNENGYWMDA